MIFGHNAASKDSAREENMRISKFVYVLAFVLFVVSASHAQVWNQWGGADRTFVVGGAAKLANAWPEGGPKRLWERELGEGHSAVVTDGARLYTMYRKGEQEVAVALDPKDGKTLWEQAYDAPTKGMNYQFGYGPHATPLVLGGKLFTAGALAKLHALDAKTGKILWTRDLLQEYGGFKWDRGYSCSPLAYKDMIIVTVGGKQGRALMAFKQKDGAVAWQAEDLDVSPSSPMLFRVGGQEQLVVFMGKEIAGFDPANGKLLWSHPHETQYKLNITTPIWNEQDGLLYMSSAYNGGSRVLKLERGKDGKTAVTELWFHRRMRVHHGTAVRVGDTVYASSGDFGPAFVVAANIKTGDVLWQDRSFSKANFLYADGKLIILDEDGKLALATVSPAGLKVLSQVELLKKISWTAPTLVGARLYVRDRKTLIALDLS
jgi:outer membrane protein assembly factor BamB